MGRGERNGGDRIVMDLKQQFREYELYELGRKPSTVEKYIERLEMWERVTHKAAEDIGPLDARAFKREAPYAAATMRGMITAIRIFHDWGNLEGLWEPNGIERVRPAGNYDEERTSPPLPREKVLALTQACRRPLEYRLVYYGAYAGMRIGESAKVDGSMWEDGWLRFRGEKNGRMREVPIHRELQAVKWKILASPPTYDATLQRVKRRLEDRVGFEFVAHQLRKSFMTTLFDEDVPDRVVKDIVGHAQDVSGRYIEVSRRRKQEAMARLDYQQLSLAL